MSASQLQPEKPATDISSGHRLQFIAAFFAIYILWGTTFLGIRIAVTEMPPLFAAAARFFIAGTLLYGFLRLRGTPAPTRSEWRNMALMGLLMFVTGYGALFWAEKSLPSGIAAVFAATIPIFTLIAEATLLRQQRFSLPLALATALGFAGVAVLMLPGEKISVPIWPAVELLLGSTAWATGGVLSHSLALPPSRLLTSGATMMLGGIGLFALSALFGELRPLPHMTTRGLLALAYLVIVGSLLGFSAYMWLLAHLPATRVASYAYVNPIVAVLIGYFLAAEPITLHTALGGALVLIAVFIILRAKQQHA